MIATRLSLKLALLTCAIALMLAAQVRADDRADIRAVEDHVIDAINAKDIDAMMRNYVTDGLLVFDDAMPFQLEGADAWRKTWTGVFARARSFDVKVSNFVVETAGDLGIAHGVVHIEFVGDKGKLSETARLTEAYRKVGGNWLIFHEHLSVPIDPATGKGVLDAKP
ncbi:MAG: nuclear transport factor 2 family protein [Candidatus Binatus sp.]|uniref:YybH family protein n=1 Tax=Candidatus Binatus sp. TaxID=2811406 RepID=UPI002717715D|nr:nuclear transport factor 2 family protein [Candidatus Binatus sp.]MDO8431285.1 nuclear transport factor 2 family protein [Candidatus Binatus sp.]